MTFPKRRRKESRCLTKWQLNNQNYKKRRIITKGQIQCHSWWMDQLFLFFLVCSGLKKGFQLGCDHQGAVNNHFFCVFGYLRHGDNQPTNRTNNQVMQEQACSWPVRSEGSILQKSFGWWWQCWAKFFGQSGKRWRLIERELCHRC